MREPVWGSFRWAHCLMALCSGRVALKVRQGVALKSVQLALRRRHIHPILDA